MNTSDKRNAAEFNNKNEQKGMQEEFQKEKNAGDPSKQDDMSLDDSIRNNADVSGTTFGMDSNTAKFSNIGQKNQTRKGEDNNSNEDVNSSNRESGNGGSGYSDYLNKADDEFISGTGQFNRTGSSE